MASLQGRSESKNTGDTIRGGSRETAARKSLPAARGAEKPSGFQQKLVACLWGVMIRTTRQG